MSRFHSHFPSLCPPLPPPPHPQFAVLFHTKSENKTYDFHFLLLYTCFSFCEIGEKFSRSLHSSLLTQAWSSRPACLWPYLHFCVDLPVGRPDGYRLAHGMLRQTVTFAVWKYRCDFKVCFLQKIQVCLELDKYIVPFHRVCTSAVPPAFCSSYPNL